MQMISYSAKESVSIMLNIINYFSFILIYVFLDLQPFPYEEIKGNIT